MKQMNRDEWRDHLGEAKFRELERLAENPTALEALEDFLCVEMKHDNAAAPGRPADQQGNFFFSYVLNTQENDTESMKYLRGYAVGLKLVQDSLRGIEKLKKEPETKEEEGNPAV